MTVLIACPEGAYGGSQLFNRARRSLSVIAKDLLHGSLELNKTCLLLLSAMLLGTRYRNHHSVRFATHQSFAFYYSLPRMGPINVPSRFVAEPMRSNIQTYGVELTLIEQGWLKSREDRQVSEDGERTGMQQRRTYGT